MRHPTMLMIEELRRKQLVYRDSKTSSGLVPLEDAIELMERLEIKLLDYYEKETDKNKILKQND